jgi:hypothetical protein
MKKYFFVLQIFTALSSCVTGQNVGIGTSSPDYKLDIVGILHSSSNAYIDGSLGIGTTSPGYKFQVTNGPIALYNSTDAKAWTLNYSSGSNYFYISENAATRLVIANGGNVGIGTSAPAVKLDVAGDGNFDGDLTVSGNRGLIRNAAGSTQLRYYTRTAGFTAILPAFGTSVETSIGFSGFTGTPKVMVGDIVSTGGTVGQLYRVQLVIYDVTPTGCHARLINTSNSAVNYDITWNIICIGN